MPSEVLTLSELLGKPEFQPTKRMDSTAEQIVMAHVQSRRSADLFPLSTDDLTTLIEKFAEELDTYADLGEFGEGVEGLTLFRPRAKPIVRVSGLLNESSNENRLRSTLAHELGHVLLHDPLFQRKAQESLFDTSVQYLQVCYRDGAESLGQGDLFEYQAWYMCGALLMPISELTARVTAKAQASDSYSEIWHDSALGQEVIEDASSWFCVSKALARIRLLKTSLIVETEPSPALF